MVCRRGSAGRLGSVLRLLDQPRAVIDRGGRRHPVTAVGPLASVQEGEQLHLKGAFELHPKWGEQFKVVWWYAVLPATVRGIQKYLASGLVKGIGPELARRKTGEYVGEMALDGGPRSASVMTLEPTTCSVVTRVAVSRLIAATVASVLISSIFLPFSIRFSSSPPLGP